MAHTFRFLDLPPELRSIIYTFEFFSYTRESTVDLDKARAQLPPSSLTRVCRQIRHETLKLHGEATTEFWVTTTIHIRITESEYIPHHIPGEQHILAEYAKLSKLSDTNIQRLVITGTLGSRHQDASIEIRVTAEAGSTRASWTYTRHDHMQRTDHRNSLNVAIAQLLKDQMGNIAAVRSRSHYGIGAKGLDVDACIKAVRNIYFY